MAVQGEGRSLALLGSGFQRETRLEAVSCARKLESVRVYSRKPERRESFARRMGDKLGLAVEAASSPEEAMEGADVVTTVASPRHPVFRGGLLGPGTEINPAGSNHVLLRGLDAEAIRKSSVIAADSLERARTGTGDLTQAADEGVMDWSEVSELHQILAGHLPGRTYADQITLFESSSRRCPNPSPKASRTMTVRPSQWDRTVESGWRGSRSRVGRTRSSIDGVTWQSAVTRHGICRPWPGPEDSARRARKSGGGRHRREAAARRCARDSTAAARRA